MKNNLSQKTQLILTKYNLSAKKNFGQNFLIDDYVIDEIINVAHIEHNDVIIEIGPGLGTLTKELLKTSYQVNTFEIDPRFEFILKEQFCNMDNFNLFLTDFLTYDLEDLIKNIDSNCNLKVVANLPYYITSEIIFKLARYFKNIKQMVIMVQKEVGDKFTNLKNNKQKSVLTYLCQYYFNIVKVIDVPSNSFIPSPNVDSVVINFQTSIPNNIVVNEDVFVDVIKSLLKMRRKTVFNNLLGYLHDKNKVELILNCLNIARNLRAEQLELNDFVNITNQICAL